MHYSLYFSRLILCTFLFVSPINFDETLFPLTRTNTLYWTLKVETIDLGYNSNVTYNSSTISEHTAKHNYQIVYTLEINCNSACALASTDTGYNIDSNHVVKYNFERVSKTPSEMSSLLANLTKYGTEQKTYTYSTSESNPCDVNFTLAMLNGNWVTHVYFPATTEGIMLDNINTHLRAFELSFDEWKLLDIEHKTMEIKYWINQMNNSGRPLPTSIYNNVTDALNNSDPDSAFTIVNNYYYDSIPTENAQIDNSLNFNDSVTQNLRYGYTQEKIFTEDIEDELNNNLQNIDTENSIITNSSFQQSANWVKTQFERMTSNNAFGSILGFSLLIGFAMAIIGRIFK